MLGKLIAGAIAATVIVGCEPGSIGAARTGTASAAASGVYAGAAAPVESTGGRDDVPIAPTHGHGSVASGDTGSPGAVAGTGAARAPGVAGSGTAARSPVAGSGSTARIPNTNADDSGMPDSVVSVIASTSLYRPSDLAFNPYVLDELWVVNHADSSASIITNASTAFRSVQRRQDAEGAQHFMTSPTSIAFGGRETTIVDAQGKMVEGTFATCTESPLDGMGPTLWASDLRIFGVVKSDREPPFNGPDTGDEGPGSHIDMLHRSPSCTGMDWEGSGNIYWTYSAAKSMFVKYDFAQDHGIGNSYHSDGSVWRYRVDGIGYVATIPSHMVYEPGSKLLYMVDTGHGRVVVFDPAGATSSTRMTQDENLDHLQVALDMAGGQVAELIPASAGLKKPSGIEIHQGYLYVSDNETSTIHKFSLAGTPLGRVVIPDVAAGGLAGITFGPDGKLYLVDMVDSRVLRLEAPF